MRINGNQTNPGSVKPYSATAERAVGGRKKSVKSAVGFDGACGPTEAFNLAYRVDNHPARVANSHNPDAASPARITPESASARTGI